MYRGKIELDANGKAVVELPEYVELINRNYTYDLTPIGASMPNLYIAEEVSNGKFLIAGGVAGKTVSWKLTGERNDPYFQQKPEKRQVVVEKEGPRVGGYFHPELYDQPEEKGYFNGLDIRARSLSKIKCNPRSATCKRTPKTSLFRRQSAGARGGLQKRQDRVPDTISHAMRSRLL